MTVCGYVILYKLDYSDERKKPEEIDRDGIASKEIASAKISLIKGECPVAVAVCERNQYVLVQLGLRHRGLSSRMFVFKIKLKDPQSLDKAEHYQLLEKAVLNQRKDKTVKMEKGDKGQIVEIVEEKGLKWKLALGNFGYLGTHLIWFGLSWNKDELLIKLYDYCLKEAELNAVENLKVVGQDKLKQVPCAVKLIRKKEDDGSGLRKVKFYFTGDPEDGKEAKVKILELALQKP